MNRAVDGDVVAVELLPESQWVGASELVLEDEGEDGGADLTQAEKAVKLAQRTHEDVRPTGRIVAIVRRKWRQYCGIIQPNSVAGVRSFNRNKKLEMVRGGTSRAWSARKPRLYLRI